MTNVSKTATGVVVGAEGPSAGEVVRVTIRDDGGQVHEYAVGTLDVTGGGLPGAHLREHLVSGIPIRYTILDNVLIRYVDAE